MARRKPLRRRKGETKKRNVMYLVLLVLLIIFFATIGVRLVINASLFISGVSKEDVSSLKDSTDRDILLAPELFDVPDATNSARINVTGRATADTELTIYVNDEKVDTQTLDEEEFEASISLEQGENTIYVEIEDTKSKKLKESEVYKVVYISGTPSLEISSPANGTSTDKNETTIEGSTDVGVSLRINGSPVVVGTDGSFKKIVRLKEGENTIEVEAEDIAGNIESTTLDIRFEKD